MAQFALKDIKPNPFRHIERYPIRPEKVAALRESLRTTGYWGNVVARSVNGYAEIAYGHHRLAALREEYGPSEKIDLLINDLSDDAMLQIMARENMEEWGTSAAIEQETVRAVVEAWAAGRIHLSSVPADAPSNVIRHAPSFIVGGDVPPLSGERPYTAKTVATFVGWLKPTGEPQDKVIDALAALQFIEEGLLTEADFDGLSTTQARAVISEARKARERRDAAARTQRIQAERAAKEVAEAQRRREQAERDRQRREAEAAAAQKRREEAEQERKRQEVEAAGAKRRQEAAERERRQHEAEAAKAKQEVDRRRAQEDADRAARAREKADAERRKAQEEAARQKKLEAEAQAKQLRARQNVERAEQEKRQAEAARQQAERRQQTAEKVAQEHREEGRRSATTVGRAVSQELKSGRIGTQRARDFAAKMDTDKTGARPDIENFSKRLTAEISTILRGDADQRVLRLEEVIKYRDYLSDVARQELAQSLRQVSDRCLDYAKDLWTMAQPSHGTTPRKLAKDRG